MVGHDFNDIGIPCSLMVRHTKFLVLSCVRPLYLSQNLSVFTKKTTVCWKLLTSLNFKYLILNGFTQQFGQSS